VPGGVQPGGVLVFVGVAVLAGTVLVGVGVFTGTVFVGVAVFSTTVVKVGVAVLGVQFEGPFGSVMATGPREASQ
jgi:type IV secretory pathway TrbL component